MMIPSTAAYCGGARFAAARPATRIALPSLNFNPSRLVVRPLGLPVTLRQAPYDPQAQSAHVGGSRSVHISSAIIGGHSPQRRRRDVAGRASEQPAHCSAARIAAGGIVSRQNRPGVPDAALGALILGIKRDTGLRRYFSFRSSRLERDGKDPKEQYVSSLPQAPVYLSMIAQRRPTDRRGNPV